MTEFSIILLALLVSGATAQCPPLYDLVGGRCFLFIPDFLVTYLEASDICQNYGGKLAKLDECHLLPDITTYYEESGLGNWNYWIDATDVFEEGTFVWSDGTPVPMGAPFWGSAITSGSPEPQDDDGDDCVALSILDGYYFHNEDCSSEYSFLCQNSAMEQYDCPSPYVSLAGGCYYLIDGVVGDWQGGNGICEATGGHLAYIDDCSKMSPIISYIEQFGLTSNVWIGGQRVGTTWRWSDGSDMPMGSPFWGLDQTGGLAPDGGDDENCVYVWSTTGFHLRDIRCSASISPLCEAPLLSEAHPQLNN